MQQLLITAALLAVTLLCCCQYINGVYAFQHGNLQHRRQYQQQQSSSIRTISTLNAKSRKARRQVERSRPKSFYDAIEDAQGKNVNGNDNSNEKKSANIATKDSSSDQKQQQQTDEGKSTDPVQADRDARALEAQQRMDQRPELSTMLIDEETGVEILAQGKKVLDVVTRKAVQLSNLGPEYRLAQMFPGVPPDLRQKYRFANWKTVKVPEMVEALQEACFVKQQSSDGSTVRDIPPHPSVANKALDFVTANRDYLGYRMKRTLGRLTMRSMWQNDKDQAKAYQKLWKHYMTIENHLSAPFRQMIMDAEGRVGPNFGNLDVMSYANGEVYERCANYLVLKGMVAQWEKKVLDAEYIESNPQTKDNYITVLSRGDPKRYLPDPPILFTLRDCAQVVSMAQRMNKAFVDTPELFDDLPPEVRFIEKALTIKGGTLLRQYMVEDFCPAENITPEGLREGMRRLIAQLDSMQIDPYADLLNILERLNSAMAVGTDDEYSPYNEYLANMDPNGPGYFQTYTFDHEKLSRVRFLDSQYEGIEVGKARSTPNGAGGGLGSLFGLGGVSANGATPKTSTTADSKLDSSDTYKVPPARAAGRPHNLGWLDLLSGDEQPGEKIQFGKVPPGRIIPDDEA